jgi:hypothetical protein
LDNPLHVILNNSKLAYRIYVILTANKELKKIKLLYVSTSGLENENTAVGIRRTDHVTSSIVKNWTSITSDSRSVCIARLQTEATEFVLYVSTILGHIEAIFHLLKLLHCLHC